MPILISVSAHAQSHASKNDGNNSIFSDTGQGGHWIEQFFPYNNPRLEGIHAAVGKMLEVYNTGILVLAGILTLYAIVTFVMDSAHTGNVGGTRHNTLYGPLRLVIALALLIPMGTGYNGAQIVALKLAESGSGLANSVWKKFQPSSTSLDFSQSAFATGNVDAFLQKAMIDEACFAAIQLDGAKSGHTGTVTIQAFYPGRAYAGHDDEGAEIPLTGTGSDSGVDYMAAQGAIATESRLHGQIAHGLRIHYNRNGNDDYCGSLDLPVPVVPENAALDPEDQTAYAAAYLQVRPILSGYAGKLAGAIDGAINAHAVPKQAPPVQQQPQSLAYIPPEPSTTAAPPATPATPAATPALPAIEVPHIELPVAAWDAMIDKFNGALVDATDRLQQRYIDAEVEHDYTEVSDTDWVWAGSLFFKLTRLSHDDLRLRYSVVSASLPTAAILPGEMRSDGQLASCPEIRTDVFLPDFNCRPEGKETTLVIKTAHDILHTVESQRPGNAQAVIDAGPGSNSNRDALSNDLVAASRLDAVLVALAHTAHANNPAANDIRNSGKTGANPAKQDDRFNSMFDAVNIGNALYLSSSSLYREASLAGGAGGNGVPSMVLSLFASLILVPAFFLAVYLPLLPALRFFLGIATWLITVFEALVALPLITMVQLRTEGEGIMSHGKQGWFLLLQMLLRPALMIFGLMAGIIIFEALYGFITWAIWIGLLHVTGEPGQFGTGIEGMLELMGYLFFWALLIYFAANLSFNFITAIPDRVLLWIGAADTGTSVQVTAPYSSATATINGGAAAVSLAATTQAASLVTGDAGLATMQIGRSGDAGPAGATGEHFPNVAEVDLSSGPIINNSSQSTSDNIAGRDGHTGIIAEKREISGRPKHMPRDPNDNVPPVISDDNK